MGNAWTKLKGRPPHQRRQQRVTSSVVRSSRQRSQPDDAREAESFPPPIRAKKVEPNQATCQIDMQDIPLTVESHYAVLCHLLKLHATDWEKIGVCLGFLPGELKIIRAAPLLLEDAPVSWLNAMLEKFLRGDYGQSVGRGVATLSVLESALSKAGLGATASQLREDIQQQQQQQQQQGTCTSKVIVEYADRLKGIYSNRTMPDYLKGRQLRTKSFVELALVHQRELPRREMDEFTRGTVQEGDIDAIMRKKTRLGMEDIGKLNSGALAKCMLFQGGPGVGKTTLAWKLCREWQPGEPGAMFAEYSLVVFVPLRRKEVREAKELGDLFSFGTDDKKSRDALAEELRRNQNDKVLLVLDGYDELPVEMQKDSLFTRIVSGELLPNVNVLVTSRPSCCDTLYGKCSQREGFQHIEVLGFTQSKIDAYIEENVPPELRPKFQTYLTSHPKIRSMLYNPLQCALTVEVCKKMFEEGSTLPVTRTKLYESNILMTVLREDPTLGRIRCLRQLPQALHKKFAKLCHLAYDGIVRQQVIFEDVPEDVQKLGLVVHEPDIYSAVPTSETFNFFHLTIQEFCAGYHLSLLTEQEREEILKEHIKKRHFREVVIFLCGLCDNPSSIIDNVFQHAPKFKQVYFHRVGCRFFLHCAMESQNDDVITNLVKKLNSSIDLRREHLNPSDLSTVGFVMIRSKHPIKSLNLDECYCGDDGIKALFHQIQQSSVEHTSLSIEELNLCNNSFGADGAKCLADGLQHCPKLQTLNLSHNSIDADGAKCLADGLQHCPNLQNLNLSWNYIGANGAKCLADGLQHCPNLQTLDLHDNNIGDDGAGYISEGLKHCPRLQTLNLRSNRIGDEGAGYISEGLKHCPRLQELVLRYSNIGVEGARYISEGLKHCPRLQTLDLGINYIGDEGARYISEGLKHCPRLQALNVIDTEMTVEGKFALVKMEVEMNSYSKRQPHEKNLEIIFRY